MTVLLTETRATVFNFTVVTIDGSAFSLTFYHTSLQEIKTFGLGSTTGDVFFEICSNIELCVTSINFSI